mmetsp:Transcript_1297/g.1970  ORF Transcript_1297/g.1970 Transcript_1297/m.1970 type:complete len:1054 (+) Transcript_1297:27-3188(+)
MTTDNAASNDSSSEYVKDLWKNVMDYPELVQQEEERMKTPCNVMGWVGYLDLLEDTWRQVLEFKQTKNQEKRVEICQRWIRVGDYTSIAKEFYRFYLWVGHRALHYLPGSYKLWKRLLQFQTVQLRRSNPDDAKSSHHRQIHAIVACFEASLRRCHKMPRIWIEYIGFMQTYILPEKVTMWRRLLNRALQALPVTQHDKIWNEVILPYLEDEKNEKSSKWLLPSETIVSILRRYCQFNPMFRCKLAEMCCINPLNITSTETTELEIDSDDKSSRLWERPGEAALLYLDVLQDPLTPSTQKHDLWIKFSDLVCQYPRKCMDVGIDFELLVRGALLQSSSSFKNPITADEEEQSKTQTQSEAREPPANNTPENTTATSLGEMEGTLWAKLATYHTRLGNFEMARSIYEEAMEEHVTKVRDFSILFDAYTQLEEGLLEALMSNSDEGEEEKEGSAKTNNGTNDNDDWDILLDRSSSQSNATDSLEFAIARAEHLTARRPLLLNHVLLKQNPHNVGEWLHRAKLYDSPSDSDKNQGNANAINMAIATLREAFTKVKASKAINGSPSELVLDLAQLYERSPTSETEGQVTNLDRVRKFYEEICIEHVYEFSKMEDLASCWSAWVEFELRHEQWDSALSLARQAVASPMSSQTKNTKQKYKKKRVKPLSQSLKLWDLLLDLEESLGTVQTTKDSYNRAMELKVATTMHIYNFASFLQDKKYWEDSFTVLERGLDLFPQFPSAKLLWKFYLETFLKRYEGTKVERVRELFRRCLDPSTCPAEECAEFFLLQGEFEEQYGLVKRALQVYRTMCGQVPPNTKEQYTAYQLYATKTTQYLGKTATRDVYQEAIAAVNDDTLCAKFCLQFAKLEAYDLHELDRARKIMAYGAPMANPNTLPEFWKEWHELEVAHGNEETYREMLRIKRSAATAFSTINASIGHDHNASNQESMNPEEALEAIAREEGVDLEEQQQKQSKAAPPVLEGFVATTKKRSLEDVEERVAKLRKAVADDEIDIDDEDEIDIDDDEEEEEEGTPSLKKVQNVSTKQVPAAVFGGLATGGA